MNITTVTKNAANQPYDVASVNIFGFWIYILQDLFLFATLFANFAIFSAAYDKGPAGKEFIDLLYVLIETFVLLLSSITYGIAMIMMHQNSLYKTQLWLVVTCLLGIIFIIMELSEFTYLIREGALPSVSAYWSAFFILVGTHGIHVTAGLIWILCMFWHLMLAGLSQDNKIRLTCLSLFWHFLDIIWVGVFTVVYLMEALQ